MEAEDVEPFEVTSLDISPVSSEISEPVKLNIDFKANKSMEGVVWKVKYMVDTAMKR